MPHIVLSRPHRALAGDDHLMAEVMLALGIVMMAVHFHKGHDRSSRFLHDILHRT